MLRILVRRDVLSHTHLFLRQAPAAFFWNYAAGACAHADKQGRGAATGLLLQFNAVRRDELRQRLIVKREL
ncbi:MAG TPA: hypothetical protein VHB99_07465 [Pirellulales bacterium]|nr:hypothetical protein [Pirellulales bacterium]